MTDNEQEANDPMTESNEHPDQPSREGEQVEPKFSDNDRVAQCAECLFFWMVPTGMPWLDCEECDGPAMDVLAALKAARSTLQAAEAERDRIEQLGREKMIERDEANAKLALVDDAIQRVAFFDDAGQPALLSHQQMHKHHADEPYIGCVFCYPEFVPKAAAEAREDALRRGIEEEASHLAVSDREARKNERLRSLLSTQQATDD